MKSYLYHLQININFQNNSFYKNLLKFLGWLIIFEDKDVAGFKSGKNGDLWFLQSPKQILTDYDQFGVNHISIRVEEKNNVDEVIEFLRKNDIKTLFNTPRHRPEFAAEKNETYYQVMFKSPDNILFEIVFIGPK